MDLAVQEFQEKKLFNLDKMQCLSPLKPLQVKVAKGTDQETITQLFQKFERNRNVADSFAGNVRQHWWLLQNQVCRELLNIVFESQ